MTINFAFTPALRVSDGSGTTNETPWRCTYVDQNSKSVTVEHNWPAAA